MFALRQLVHFVLIWLLQHSHPHTHSYIFMYMQHSFAKISAHDLPHSFRYAPTCAFALHLRSASAASVCARACAYACCWLFFVAKLRACLCQQRKLTLITPQWFSWTHLVHPLRCTTLFTALQPLAPVACCCTPLSTPRRGHLFACFVACVELPYWKSSWIYDSAINNA